MSLVREAAERLEAALATVGDLRVTRDLGSNVDPPAAIIGPPRLDWDGYLPLGELAQPTSATCVVYVAVANDDRSLERLWEFVPRVAAALSEVQDAVTTSALPGMFPVGNADLPCYEITVEMSLT
ncbi:hypothetical protein [Prauserella cavernicola]|uniref:Uncharacterized protein n=1 Tax=Prauserella cavernicola TaxID=2800127 RepID=A0A934QS15_9PSEU|nr:hypothetical protein [Prauserella cavernicola]MBK1785133.1 hypothetical protein [Prauserella cavernicola]